MLVLCSLELQLSLVSSCFREGTESGKSLLSQLEGRSLQIWNCWPNSWLELGTHLCFWICALMLTLINMWTLMLCVWRAELINWFQWPPMCTSIWKKKATCQLRARNNYVYFTSWYGLPVDPFFGLQQWVDRFQEMSNCTRGLECCDMYMIPRLCNCSQLAWTLKPKREAAKDQLYSIECAGQLKHCSKWLTTLLSASQK